MKSLSTQLLLGALALGTLSTVAVADTTKSFLLCTTQFGISSVQNVPTQTYALTLTSKATVKVTSTPSTTVTPPPATSTVSTTTTLTSSTTAPQITDTVSSTTTTTLVSTETSTATITATYFSSTTTTSSVTTTIPTSPGFTPAISEISATPTFVRRSHVRDVRGIKPSATTCKVGQDGKPTFNPQVYPQKVVCAGLIEVFTTRTVTFTATSTSTVTAAPPPPVSTTTTFTDTTTSTVIPVDASTTVTVTNTESSTTTQSTTVSTTVTSTTTTTVTLPTATFYAACDPATNQVSSYKGVNFDGFGYKNALSRSTTQTAYDCCVSCITSATCGASIFYGSAKLCFQIAETNNVCNPAVQVIDVFGNGQSPANTLILSSGNCGAVSYQPET